MTMLINFQNKLVPVYFSTENKQPVQKTLRLLSHTLELKIQNGKRALKKCLDSLISIEIVGSEAILHSKSEDDSLALSLY
ncbi:MULTISPECIES: hypothetical protein [Paenibacillus]|jgi:hypothetical protein|uniref:Uncharacterized protein n=3 Tax=Paenibacillus TaxID=44249 RepID=A0A168MSW7_9BACL|nr:MULTISPECIES: hypothetical protein [Paenibacillus]OAB35724.1 hypothetical protein PMSD_11990 [Paenibacillus macquariensis subsp. defensor]MEC0091299.1 hypothetical protein [Paenibacillus macquariensis]OAB37991.1 hypothetical protein PMSM_02290 [Paenibacillus macquariensis subsp. macquariensis]OAB41449.1 hypothetical protein PGLA_16755 [Paenibacillus glacialis]OAB45014.1 hypothetical protein PBAT_13780 [Paenibacillus antarcticus]